MLKQVIPIILLFTLPTNGMKGKTEKRKIKKIQPTELFSSTEQYQIMSWTIKKFEGYRSEPYLCAAGKRTVGWGFTDVKRVRNSKHADLIFKRQLEKRWRVVNREFKHLTYLQRAAIVSLLYNTGDIKKIKQSSFVSALNKGNVGLAANRLQRWNKIRTYEGMKELPGLTERRKFESKLLTGEFTREDYQQLKEEVSLQYKN